MKRVKQIGNIPLDNHLFWVETFELKNVKGTVFNTLAGGRVVFETQKRDTAINITLDSKDYGWQLGQTIEKILAIADDIGVVVPITFTDDTEIEARVRVEENEVIKAEPKYEGSKWYNVTIKMAKV